MGVWHTSAPRPRLHPHPRPHNGRSHLRLLTGFDPSEPLLSPRHSMPLTLALIQNLQIGCAAAEHSRPRAATPPPSRGGCGQQRIRDAVRVRGPGQGPGAQGLHYLLVHSAAPHPLRRCQGHVLSGAKTSERRLPWVEGGLQHCALLFGRPATSVSTSSSASSAKRRTISTSDRIAVRTHGLL